MLKLASWNGVQTPAPAVHAPLPEIGELVRLQSVSDMKPSFHSARVRSLPFRRMLFDLIGTLPSEIHTLDAISAQSPFSVRGLTIVSFARGDALYQFETKIIGSSRSGSIITHRPGTVTRVQRREYYRLPLESPTTFRVLNGNDEEQTSLQVGRLVNLSGGGALIASSQAVGPRTLVRLRVPSGQRGEPIDVAAKVIECSVAATGSSRVYLLRAQFLLGPYLTDEDRDSIIAYIFQKQRLQLRARRHLK